MFIMTPALKDHLVKSFSLKADATDDEALKLAATKYGSGEITGEQIKEFTKQADPNAKIGELGDSIASKVAGALNPALTAIGDALKGLTKPAEKPPENPVITKDAAEAERLAAFETRMKDLETSFDTKIAAAAGSKASSVLLLGAGLSKDGDMDVIVKSVKSKYSESNRPVVRTKGIFVGE